MVGRFFAWWLGELRACVPGPLAALLFGVTEELEVTLEDGEARFVGRRDGRQRELGEIDLAEADRRAIETEARALLRGRRGAGPVTLRLPAAQVLRPRVELPIAAAENLREVLALEMDRHTPFPAAEVMFDFRVGGSDPELERLNVDMLVARRRDVEAALDTARAMTLRPDRIAGPTGAGSEAPFNLLPEEARPRPNRLLPRLNLAMAVLTLALAGVAFELWLDRKEQALDEIEGRVAQLRASMGEAGRLEEEMDRLQKVSAYLAEQKQQRPSGAEVIDEVTRRLPDEYWLISYAARGDNLILTGYADDPSGVLKLLEESPLLSEARFAAPVTMDPRIGKERFNVSVTVGRAGGGQ